MAWRIAHRTLLLLVLLQARSLAQAVVEPQVVRGLNPATLLQQAKATQDWFSKVKSIYLKFDDGAILAFDETRLYESRSTFGKTFASWDGTVGVRSMRAGVIELVDKVDSISQGFMTSTAWGRSGQVYWWSAGRASDLLRDVVADYPVRTAKRNGIDCYLVRVRFDADVWIGVNDQLVYQTGRPEYVFEDYKEIAPGRWYPMTQRQGSRSVRVTELVIDKPLPAVLFESPFVEGMNVHDTRGGVSIDYVYHAGQDADEAAEIVADAARRKRFADPPRDPGQPVSLNPTVNALPLNPLAIHPAPEFPAAGKWIGSDPKKLADLRGKVVLVVFWASWSSFAEAPQRTNAKLMELSLPDSLKADSVLLGVHVPTTNIQRVEKAMTTHGISFPVCIDMPSDKPGEGWGIMSEAYRIEDMPITYVINAEGRIAYRGTFSQSLLRAGELLGKPAEKK